MYPHIRFAAFLLAKKKSLEIIKDLPRPSPEEVTRVFPNLKGTRRWYQFSKTESLADKTDHAKVAYTIWRNDPFRLFMYVSVLRGIEPFEILRTHFRTEVAPEAIEVFKTLFFDVASWDRVDLNQYCELLSGRDRHIFELCLSTSETESILTDLGIKLGKIDHESYLHNMFFTAYDRFMKDGDLSWGKFAVTLEKRIADVTQMTKRDILKELNLELEGLKKPVTFDFEDGIPDPEAPES